MEKMYWMYNGTYSGKYIGNIVEYLMDKMYWMHHVILGGKIMRSVSIIKAVAEGTVQNFGPVTHFWSIMDYKLSYYWITMAFMLSH